MKIIKGDLVQALKDGEIDVLIHQVNCQGKMGSGLAKQIRDEWPIHYRDYIVFCEDVVPKRLLGQIVETVVDRPVYEAHIVGIFGQLRYGYNREKYTNYSALTSTLAKAGNKFRYYKIGIPYQIGCGLGSGDWDVVKQLIEDVEEMTGVEFLCYQL